jgi:hypothetical protein
MHFLWDRMFGTDEESYRRKCAERAAVREARAAEMKAMDENIKGTGNEVENEDGECRSRMKVGGA